VSGPVCPPAPATAPGLVTARGLGKAYRQYASRWGRLAEWLLPGATRHTLRWVLQGVDLHIEPGQTVGLVGANGAGKSTLLRVLAGITRATHGECAAHGRVAALLELGMGFHPQFSGRHNALLALQLAGHSAAAAQALLPQVEQFAEIGDHLDQPLRVYSSGMQVRLAFAVATAVRPDVLIVDEALSVGDTYFQHKSFERIRSFREAGSTIILVSHDRATIQSICDRALLLEQGRVVQDGPADVVMDAYNARMAGLAEAQQATASGAVQTVSGDGRVRLAEVALLDAAGNQLPEVHTGQPVRLQVRLAASPGPADPLDPTNARDTTLVVGYQLRDRLGQVVYGSNTHHLGIRVPAPQPGGDTLLEFDFDALLGPGNYALTLAVHPGADHLQGCHEWRDRALVFEVRNAGLPAFEGVACLQPQVRVQAGMEAAA